MKRPQLTAHCRTQMNTATIRWVISALVVAFSASAAFAQSMTVYNINASAFPTITADYAAFGTDGNALTGLTAADFTVTEKANGGPFVNVTPTLKHDCDPQTKDPEATILIILDRSNSMRDEVAGKTRFLWAKEAINNFVRQIKFVGETRVCLVTFSGNYEVKVDWTNDPKIISDTLAKMEPQSATNYEIPFDSPGNNIYEKFKERPANIGKYAFFITDGHPNPGIGDEYKFVDDNVAKLNAQGIRFYSVTLLVPSTHWTLEVLSSKTGGKSLVTKEGDLLDLLSHLGLETQRTEVCRLTWTAPFGCHPDDRNRTASITLKRGGNPTQLVNYYAPPNSVATVKLSDPVLFCGDPLANQTSIALVTLTAQNAPLVVTGQSMNPSTYFSVLDWNHPANQGTFAPFTLNVGQSRTLRVQFRQGPQRIYRQAELRFEGSPCPPIIDLVGGQGVVKVSHPNGGELFSTCDTVTITWSGVLPTQPVKLEYTSDNGTTWNLITQAATGLSYKWLPPNAGTQYKIRASVETVDQYQWAVGAGATGTETATAVAVSKNDLDVYTTGYFDGPTKFGTTVVSNELGNIDGYLIKWTADGNIAKVTILKGSGQNDDRVMGVVTDTLGNYYVVGYFTSPSIQFGSLNKPLGTGDGSNMFIYAFDQNDNLKWSGYGTGSGLNTSICTGMNVGVRYDANGRPEVIVSGTFQRFIRVGQRSTGGWVESNRYTNNTNRNYWAVYDEQGYVQLYEPAVPPAGVQMKSLKVKDSKGFEYETGNYTGSKTFAPPTITIPGYGGQDVFLSKYGSLPPSSDQSDNVFVVKSPRLEFTVSRITMDPTAQGQQSSKSFSGILCNTGDFSVVIKRYAFSGPHPTEFDLVSQLTDYRLAPGECISIELDFVPNGMGMRTANLTVMGDCGTSATVLVDGEGLAPCWYDVQAQVNVGKIPLGQSPTFTLNCVIKNTGPTTLNGSVSKSGSAAITIIAGGGSFVLPPNACHNVTVQVNAVAPGPVSISLTYGLSADCGVPSTIVVAEIIEPNVTITNVDFGRKRVGTTSYDTIKITNLNTEPAEIQSLTLSDPVDPHLKLTVPGTPFTLQPSESRDIPVVYTPTSRGSHVVTVSASILGQTDPLVGEARGIGFLPAIEATGYTFPAWTVGQTYPTNGEVVIKNVETASNLQIFDIRFATPTADFAWVNPLPTFPQVLTPGSEIRLPVSFTPQADGSRRVDVIIEHDALAGNVPPYTDTVVIVQGVGAEPSNIPPVQFGGVPTCATKTTVITIVNPNPTAPLNCSAPIGSGDVGVVGLSQTGSFVVPPASSQAIVVTFIPPTTGSFAATYTIPNDQGLSLNINVSGQGTTINADFRFGTVNGGQVGQTFNAPVNVTVGALDTVKITEITFTFTHSAEYVGLRQQSAQQAGWQLTATSPGPGISEIRAVADPGVQLRSGPFMTPQFEVFITAEANQRIAFTAVASPDCIVATGDQEDVNVELVCNANSRLVSVNTSPFSIAQPSPNPTSAALNVRYSVGLDVPTTFDLVDAVGNTVLTHVTPVQTSGSYEVTLDTDQLSDGLYFLRMSSGPFSATRQVMILK
jgi:hypothetical protein